MRERRGEAREESSREKEVVRRKSKNTFPRSSSLVHGSLTHHSQNNKCTQTLPASLKPSVPKSS